MANLKVNIAGVEFKNPIITDFRLFRIRSGI